VKLIIKEYLSLLKESNELDAFIPELLLSMNQITISKAQKGTRQYGVDVASVGIDNDGIEKVFLFTVKEGNLGRNDWDGGSVQAVRPSLDEIIDVYIPTHLQKKYSSLPKKIIVVTGGDLLQNVQQNWSGYTKKNSIKDEIEFDFWGGDELAILIENNLFNEHIIPQDLRSKFRKTIALLGDVDYDLRDYYEFLNLILEDEKLPKKPQKEQLKSLRLIFLALNIIYIWSKEENNLKHSLWASERTILNIWNYIHINNLTKKKKFTDIIGKIYFKHMDIVSQYCEKLAPLMKVENGMSMYGHSFIQESTILFKQLGILAELGSLFYFTAIMNKSTDYWSYSANITNLIKEYINNHKALYNPVYDEHIIDISLTLFLLSEWKEIKFIDDWIHELISHIQFAYSANEKYFPIDSDNFDDLVDINLQDVYNKEDYIKTSTLIPILAQWCIKLGLIENYRYIKQISEEIFENSTLQIWYPDGDIESYMYTTNAGYKCGYSEAPIKLPKKPKELAAMMNEIHNTKLVIDITKLSCIENGIAPLVLISNRHFRMPMFPQFWNIKQEI